MQCQASNPLARRIRGWSPQTCMGRPARKTRRTGKTPKSPEHGLIFTEAKWLCRTCSPSINASAFSAVCTASAFRSKVR